MSLWLWRKVAANSLCLLCKNVSLIESVVEEFSNVQVIGFNNLLVECAKQHQASVIIRGLRAVSDFEYEFQMAGMNRRLAPDIETVFLTPAEQYEFISSSMIREIAKLNGDVSSFVPEPVSEKDGVNGAQRHRNHGQED